MAHNSYPSPEQVVEGIDTVMVCQESCFKFHTLTNASQYFAGTDSFIEWTISMLTTTDKVVAAVILVRCISFKPRKEHMLNSDVTGL